MKHIDTYKTIYSVDLTVANKDVTLKDLQKKYTTIDDKELPEIEDSIACTMYAKNRETGQYTIIVKYNRDSKIKGTNKKLDLINTAAHEATHVVMAIYDYIGEKVFPQDSNELLSCLMGWATECIYKTWTRK